MEYKQSNLFLVSFFIATLIECTTIGHALGAIVNSKIDRIVDISSQLVKITERIHIEDSVGTYKLLIEPTHKMRLAYIEAAVNGQSLEISERPDGSYDVDLTGKTAKPLIVTTVYTRLLRPYPTEIVQNERQLVLYDGLQTTLSPYLTKAITTRIKLPPGSRLESFTKASKMTTGTNKLTYGPFKDVQPNQAEPLSIHYENNSPFVAVTNLLRTIEVSPWAGSIYIVNQVRISHVGAKLKGPFSRIDYQRDQMNGISSVRNLAAELPRAATNIYFRDGIGNISTSNVRYTPTKTLINMKPRFPLFGGWVTDFNLGYKVPTSEFINEPVSGNNHRFSVPFADILYESMFIDDATVRITLPAGASDIDIRGAIDFERLKDEKSYSFLDVIGRPVIVLRKSNVVSNHVDAKPLVIRYNYNRVYMVQEPLLLFATFLGLLLITALWSKLSSKSSLSTLHKAKSD